MARTMKEKALYIEEQKKRMYEQFLLKGYSPSQITELLANYPKLIAGLDCKPLPKWYTDALVCRYNPSKQGVKNGVDIVAGQTWKLKDFSGNGLDMEMHGFLGEGMSGMDGYLQDTKSWRRTDSAYEVTYTSNEIRITCISDAPGWYVMKINNYVNELWRLNFKGNEGKHNALHYFSNDGKSKEIALKNGLNTIVRIEDLDVKKEILIRVREKMSIGEVITIEQLPLYEGGLVFDGTDDYGISTNQPKLTDYTIITKRKHITTPIGSSFASKRTTLSDVDGAFWFERGTDTWSFGKGSSIKMSNELGIVYQTKNSYNGYAIGNGNKSDTNVLTLAKGAATIAAGQTPCQMVLYDFLLFNRTLTPNEIDWVKYNIMGEECEKPVAMWDAKGRRNDEPAAIRSVLLDKTGNGHNIELKNFLFAGESGYGKYDADFSNLIVTSGAVVEQKDYVKHITNTTQAQQPYIIFKESKISGNHRLVFDISGLTSAITLAFYSSTKSFSTPLKNGINVVEYREEVGGWYGFQTPYKGECDITIKILPSEYENALVFDGNDDYGICENMPIFTKEKGYTIIAVRVAEKTERAALFSNTKSPILDTCAFMDYISGSGLSSAVSFGQINRVVEETSRITFMSSDSYNGQKLVRGALNQSEYKVFVLGQWGDGSLFWKGAFYSLHIFDHDLTPSAIEAYVRKNIDANYTLPEVQL